MSQMAFDLTTAREAGRTAGDACTAKAERAGFDTEGCIRFVAGWLVRFGPTSGEDLVDAAKAHGFRWDDARCTGNVFRFALARGQIVCLRSDLLRRRGHGTSGGKLYAIGGGATS